MPGTMAEADPCGHNGSTSPTTLIVDGVLVQPRMYLFIFSQLQHHWLHLIVGNSQKAGS